MSLLQEFIACCRERQYIKQGQPTLLAVSGGEDSMVMAHLFHAAGFPFAVAHCNFALRGEDADGDEQFVKEWCGRHGVPFHSVKFDTKSKAAEWKKGIQETARILRYEWFELLRVQHRYVAVATAHHANDNVETLLINLFKGTGISGLHGIPPQNGSVIRPLLFASKDKIAAYAGANNVGFREDVSNATDDYLRNAVRHKIVPVAEQLFPGAVEHVSDSVKRFSQAEALYRKAVEAERKQLVGQRGQDYYIPILKFKKRPECETLCYEIFLPFGFGSAQVPLILKLLDAESGHYISSASHRIIKDRDFLIVTTLPSATTDVVVVDALPCSVDIGKYLFSFSIAERPAQLPADADEAWLDMKDITFPLLLRKWRAGDYLYPLGMGMKKKKVARLLIDAKVPVHEKEHVLVVECKKRVLWLAGMRIDERFKITDTTGHVLVIKRTLRQS